jgi:hypothetical protein
MESTIDHPTLRCLNIGVVTIAVSFLVSSTSIYAQHHHEIYLSNGQHVRIDDSKAGFYSVVTKNGKIQSVHQKNPDEVCGMIGSPSGTC